MWWGYNEHNSMKLYCYHIAFVADMEECLRCPDDQYANTERTHCLKKSVTFLAYEPFGDYTGRHSPGFLHTHSACPWNFCKVPKYSHCEGQ